MGKPPFKITEATLDVIEVLVSGDSELYGFKIAKLVGRPAGSIVPILMRLERHEWVTSHWEQSESSQRGPRRRFYELHPDLLAGARALLAARRPAPVEGRYPRPGLAGA